MNIRDVTRFSVTKSDLILVGFRVEKKVKGSFSPARADLGEISNSE